MHCYAGSLRQVRGVVLVQHQLAEALRWSDSVVVLQNGNRVAAGPTNSVLTEALITDIFGLTIVREGITFELAEADHATGILSALWHCSQYP